jgi:hypothetical protein
MRTLSVCAVAALAAAAVPASAAAAAQIPTRTFDVSIKGEQTTTFSSSHSSFGQCDPASHATGSERITFHSYGANTIVAKRVRRDIVVFGTGKPGTDDIDVHGRIERKSKTYTAPLDPRCLGTGGNTTPPPAPDCGVRHSNFSIGIAWWPDARTGGIILSQSLFVPLPLFKNCPVTGIAFPNVLTAATGGHQIVARIPARDLFNPDLREHIVLARGQFVSSGSDGGYTSRIRWAITLTQHTK